jgi:MoaA/NifB/PqqE/SkfB family radical SAM enzyme/pimeloyl-ACP methyl ester carboxylesterase
MSIGILLIHGFSGRPADLEPLQRELCDRFGSDAVSLCALPGHDGGMPDGFDRDELVAAVAADLRRARQRFRRLAVLGHSTGGTLALLALAETGVKVELLVLAAVPRRIDLNYLERWRQHRQGAESLSLSAVAGLVSGINAAGRLPMPAESLLLLHGTEDALVPAAEAHYWRQEHFSPAPRLVLVPEAGHQLFCSGRAQVGIETVCRALADLAGTPPPAAAQEALARLQEVEPEAQRFFSFSPASVRHLAGCPSAARLLERKPSLALKVATEPVFANIEVSTRCNLACPHCARQMLPRPPQDMAPEQFERLLDLLPHAYRVTLVGLGEPLLHPQIVSLVDMASRKGRRVALATNAMELTPELSARLLEAGLDSIAFSLDAVEPELARRVRPGIDLPRTLRHIEACVTQARALQRPISTAVFAALSTETLPHLDTLVAAVRRLGVHVLMLTDLNFRFNGACSLWRNLDAAGLVQLRQGIARAFSAGLPVLTVRGLEEFGLAERFREYLLLPPEEAARRSEKHRWCLSPWQTVAVAVDGTVTVCDCQPEVPAGNLLRQPLAEVWNGEALVSQRERMLGQEPPAACRVCPRF